MNIKKLNLINIKDFNTVQKINEGTYGTVYCVQDVKTKQKYAAKVIRIPLTNNKLIKREIAIMNRLHHPTIIKFYGISLTDFEGNDKVTLIMELAEKGSLQDLLDKSRKGTVEYFYDNTMRQKILIGIARGMMYLHQNHAIHRDLKPANILLDNNLEPHIADFGLSKFVSDNSKKSQSQSVGTHLYMAPEAIESTHYDEKVDVYSFGIIMYEIITETVPYEEFQISNKMTDFAFLQKVINENLRPEFKVPIKDSIQKLIIQCWSERPENRPSFEEIYNKLTSNECEPNEYFLDGVDEEEIFSYVEKIKMDLVENDDDDDDEEFVNQLKQRFQEQIDKMMKEHQYEVDKLKKDHQKVVNQLESEHQDEINQLKKEHQNDIDQLESEHQDEIKQLKKKHRNVVTQLKSEHQNEIDLIKKDKNDKISQIKKDHKNEINQIKTEYQDEINQIKKDHQDEVNLMKIDISNQSNTIKKLKIQINDIKEKNEIEIKKLNDVIAKNSKTALSAASTLKMISIPYSNGNEFRGIINYLKNNSNIYDEINITSSSIYKNDPSFSPFNVIKYHDLSAEFHTNDLKNSWICFEFKNHKIVPKNYSIRSFALDGNASHLKSWVVEYLNINKKWEIIDIQNDCEYLNGRNFVCTFSIENSKNIECKFLRIRQTGPNWRHKDFLKLNSIEFHGFIH